MLTGYTQCVCVLPHLKPPLLQGADGSDQLLYGQAAAAGGGLMESSYRNLQEARVTLQAVYALMTAGEDLISRHLVVHLSVWAAAAGPVMEAPTGPQELAWVPHWELSPTVFLTYLDCTSATQWWCGVLLGAGDAQTAAILTPYKGQVRWGFNGHPVMAITCRWANNISGLATISLSAAHFGVRIHLVFAVCSSQ